MDDFRIGSLGFSDSASSQMEDRSKKRSKPRQIEPQEDLTDEVMLSSAGDAQEQAPGYSPSSEEESD